MLSEIKAVSIRGAQKKSGRWCDARVGRYCIKWVE